MEAATEITIVPIGPDAAEAMAAIHAESFADAWTGAALTRLLKADAARSFGAFAGYERAPLGFVVAFVAADEAEILTLAVAQKRRRSGVGASLLRTLIEQIAGEGVERLFLEVAADNVAAHALYRRHGFVEMSRRKAYYHRTSAPAADALVLAVGLSASSTRPFDALPSPTVR